MFFMLCRGGLPVNVVGENLNSSPDPRMITYVGCSHHDLELIPHVESVSIFITLLKVYIDNPSKIL